MTRPGTARRATRRSGARPNIEILEGRSLLSGIGFTSALGVGVTGRFAAIHSNAVATDPAGDTFVTGSFRATAAFDPNSSSSTFTTASTQDAFIAKYSPTGTLVWVSTFAGQVDHFGLVHHVCHEPGVGDRGRRVGQLFSSPEASTGRSTSPARPGVLQVASVASATEPFVAKLDASGKVTWFDAVAGTAYDTDSANALALDGSGGAVIAGSFAESATFGSKTLTAGGPSEAFVARVNGSGTFLWAVASQGGTARMPRCKGSPSTPRATLTSPGSSPARSTSTPPPARPC